MSNVSLIDGHVEEESVILRLRNELEIARAERNANAKRIIQLEMELADERKRKNV